MSQLREDGWGCGGCEGCGGVGVWWERLAEGDGREGMCRKQCKSLCRHRVFRGMRDACEELLGCSSRVPCIFFGFYSFQKSPVSGPMVGQGLTLITSLPSPARMKGAKQSGTPSLCSGRAPNPIELEQEDRWESAYTKSKYFGMIYFTSRVLRKIHSSLHP